MARLVLPRTWTSFMNVRPGTFANWSTHWRIYRRILGALHAGSLSNGDEQTLLRGPNFPLTTTLGDLDVLGEIAGGGTYLELLPHTFETLVFGCPCLCLDLEELIRVKRA